MPRWLARFLPLFALLLTGHAFGQADADKPKDSFALSSAGHSLAFSPDGKLLAVGDASGAITLWKLPERKPGNPINAHTQPVQSLAFSHDGTTLLSASFDKTVKLWDIETGKLKQSLASHIEPVWSAAFQGKGMQVVSGGDDRKIRLSQADGKLIKELGESNVAVRMLDFAPDGRTLAVVGVHASGEAKVLLLNSISGTLKASWSGHTGSANCLAYSADGKLLATGGADKSIRLWDGSTGRAGKVLLGHGGTISAVGFLSGGKTLVSASADRNLRLWDVASGKSLAVLWGHTSPILSLAVSPDGTTAVTADASSLRWWDLAKARSDPTAYQIVGEEKGNLAAHLGLSVQAMAMAPGGKSLITLGSDGKLRTWDLSTKKLLREFDTHSSPTPVPLALSPDGKTLAVLKPGVHIELRDPASGKVLRILRKDASPPATTTPIRDFCFTSKGDQLIAAIEHRLIGWDLKTGAEKFAWTADDKQATVVIALPDGKHIASGGESGKVKVWQIGQAKPAHVLFAHAAPVTGLAASADGKTLATAAASEPIKTWELESGKNLRLLETAAAAHGAMLFFEDDSTLLSSDAQGNIQVWDVPGSRIRQTLRGHAIEVLRFLRGSEGAVISASGDGTVKFWEIKPK